MPTINNQIGYQIAGSYTGTVITSPAVIPAVESLPQEEPNIVSSVLSNTGTSLASSSTPIKTNTGFGIISIATQDNIVANTYMSTLTLVAGNNVTLISNSLNKSVTISTTSVIAGTGISVATANSNVTVTNTFTETVYQGGNVTGSLTPNRTNGTIQKFTLTGNITLTPPTNMSAGQSLTLILTQDSPGNRELTVSASYLFAGGFATLSNGAGEIDMLNIFYDGTVYYVTLTVGYTNA
jgi:hypothetical protein